jgi:mono/diheme cytochrome c family protein
MSEIPNESVKGDVPGKDDIAKGKLPTAPLENETSTLAVNAEAMQEADDPHEAFDAGPRWFYYFAVAALVVGGFYLGRHMGDFSNAVHIGFIDTTSVAMQAETQPKAKNEVSGPAVFTSRCATCHQPNGQGVPGAFPPLTGSPYVLGEPEILVRIILHGLQGPLEVEGQQYNGVMPAWASQLKDAEIAAVATHVRNSLGDNKADPIDEALVTKVRQETQGRDQPYTAESLKGSAEAGEKPDESSQGGEAKQ